MKQMKDSSGSPKNHKTSSKLRFNKKWQKVFWVFYWIFFDYYVWISTWKFINTGIHFFVWVQHFVNRSVKKKGGKYFSWEEKLHILKWSLSWDVYNSFLWRFSLFSINMIIVILGLSVNFLKETSIKLWTNFDVVKKGFEEIKHKKKLFKSKNGWILYYIY